MLKLYIVKNKWLKKKNPRHLPPFFRIFHSCKELPLVLDSRPQLPQLLRFSPVPFGILGAIDSCFNLSVISSLHTANTLQKTNISPPQRFEDDFPFPELGLCHNIWKQLTNKSWTPEFMFLHFFGVAGFPKNYSTTIFFSAHFGVIPRYVSSLEGSPGSTGSKTTHPDPTTGLHS